MEVLFLKTLNMSISASWLVLAIIFLRILLKRTPKAVICILWAFVAIRLILPISIESELSLVPNAELVPTEIVQLEKSETDISLNSIKLEGNTITGEGTSMDNLDKYVDSSENKDDQVVADKKVDIIHTSLDIVSKVWIIGVILMLLYMIISYMNIRIKVKEAAYFKENIWHSDNVASPFIIGIFRPRIILPTFIKESETEYVLAHEKAHLKRFDHLWKPIGFIILSFNWFNPIIWVAYILLCSDIEMACDEKVVKNTGLNYKKEYSTTLLDYSISKKILSACPLAFSEGDVKTRIQSVLTYKRPTFWILILSTIVLVFVGIGFLTNPKQEGTKTVDIEQELDEYISQIIIEDSRVDMDEDFFSCERHKVLDVEKDGYNTTVYMWSTVKHYDYIEGEIVNEGGENIPIAITVKEKDDEYSLVEYWIPEEGSNFESDIKSKFPEYICDEALNAQLYVKEFTEKCDIEAENYYINLYGGIHSESGKYVYPNIDGLYGNDIVNKCRIPEKLLGKMSTEQLAKAVIDFPMLMLHMTDSQYTGTDMLQISCDAYKEMITREDAKDVMLAQLKEFEAGTSDYSKVELLKDILWDETTFNELYTSEELAYLNSMYAYNVEVIDVGIIEFDKFNDAALNGENINGGVITSSHLIYSFYSKESFDSFNLKYGEIGMGLEGKSYEEVIGKYDEQFFEDKSLFMVYVHTGSYMINPKVKTIYINGEQFSVYLEYDDPGAVDFGGGSHLVLIEIDKDAIEECTVFGAYDYPDIK